MAEHYAALPAWAVREATTFASAEEAAVAASVQVRKDKVPRLVVRVMAEVRLPDRPQIEIVQIAEVA